jgi:phosphatidylglycerol:prolipoprotein diacylglycerol transferase
MRTNLLRFMFDSAWRFDAAGNELYVGAGWLILIWTLAVCIFSVRVYRTEGSLTEALFSAGFWLTIPAGFLGLLLLQPNLGVVRDGIPVFGYGFMMFVGFSAASWLAARRIRSIGVDPDVIWDMLMWALIPGLTGARVYFLLRHGHPAFSSTAALLAGWRGSRHFVACESCRWYRFWMC